jgi:hypothetical protein
MAPGLYHSCAGVPQLYDMIITLMFEVIRLFQIGLLTAYKSLTVPTPCAQQAQE